MMGLVYPGLVTVGRSQNALSNCKALKVNYLNYILRNAKVQPSKLEAFSDGVFAVAMTLLIYHIEVPAFSNNKTNAQLLLHLQNLWPYYISLFTSFFTLLIMWVNHHNMLKKVQKVNRHFLFANGTLLFLVIIVPFPTAMVSQFLSTPSANIACAVYAGLFVLINICYNWIWLAAIKENLLKEDISHQVIKKIAVSNFVGFPVYLIAFVIAFNNPFLSIGICILMWVYWAIAMKLS
jgi:uncharacterized membrane protein